MKCPGHDEPLIGHYSIVANLCDSFLCFYWFPNSLIKWLSICFSVQVALVVNWTCSYFFSVSFIFHSYVYCRMSVDGFCCQAWDVEWCICLYLPSSVSTFHHLSLAVSRWDTTNKVSLKTLLLVVGPDLDFALLWWCLLDCPAATKLYLLLHRKPQSVYNWVTVIKPQIFTECWSATK